MKKTVFTTIWFLIISISFKLYAQHFNTHLIGTINDVKDSTVVRLRSGSIDVEYYQKTALIINGKYKFELNLKEPIMFFLEINGKSKHFLLDKGITVLQTNNLNELNKTKILKGSKNTFDYDNFYKTKDIALNFKYIEENANKFMALYLLWRHRYNYNLTKEKLKKYFSMISNQWAYTTYYKDLKYISGNYKYYSAGNLFYNFEFTNQNNQIIRLSDFKGKYLLIYFTSRYCSPCVHSIPFHKAFFKKYHTKGFEILYVYLDKQKDVLYSKEKYKLNWNLSYLKEKNSKILKVLRFQGTPQAWLIDKKGIVITDYATNIHNLKDKLQKIFK